MRRNSYKKQQQQQNNGKKQQQQQFNLTQNAEQFSDIEARLMSTISALCKSRTPFENLDNMLLQLDVLKIRNSPEEQHAMAAQLWSAYEELVKIVPSGTSLDLDAFLAAFAESIHVETAQHSALANNALSACAFLAECIAFPFAAICPRLNQMIIDDRNTAPDSMKWKALKRINDSLCVSSMLHEYFPQFATILIGCLRSGSNENIENNRELFELVASILRTSTVLIKSLGLLTDLQRHVCIVALSPNPDICIFKLLNSLLENNHEAIPLPIQAAYTIFWRDYTRCGPEFVKEVMKGRMLCQIIARPKRSCGELKIMMMAASAISTATFDHSKEANNNMENQQQIMLAATPSSSCIFIDAMGMKGTTNEGGGYGNKPTASTHQSKSNSTTTTSAGAGGADDVGKGGVFIRKKGTFLNNVERRKLQQAAAGQSTQNDDEHCFDSSDDTDSVIALEDDDGQNAEINQEEQIGGTSSISNRMEVDKNVINNQRKKQNEKNDERTAAVGGNNFADEPTIEEIFEDFIVD